MMCPDMEVRVNEYVDGTLGAADRALVAAHLARCAGCREAAAELAGLVAGARELPRSIDPARDLWGGIAARLGPRHRGAWRRWWRERQFWAGALAAAAVLVIAFGLSRRSVPSPVPAVAEGWLAIAADYEQAATALGRTLATERASLQPETVAVVERNLRIIDAAIRESRAALERDPANADLGQLLSAAYRQKVELLRWATRVATAS